jgi:hypothetical protein
MSGSIVSTNRRTVKVPFFIFLQNAGGAKKLQKVVVTWTNQIEASLFCP